MNLWIDFRNVSFFKKLKYTDTRDDSDVNTGEDNSDVNTGEDNPVIVPLRRSQRQRRQPIRYPENDIVRE